MNNKKSKKIRLFPNVRIQVFVQFTLIFLLVISITLFSSNSFYISMIESTKMFEMREAGQLLAQLNLNDEDILEQLYSVQESHDVLIEIYARNDETQEYTEPIYSVVYQGTITTNGSKELQKKNVDYSSSDFELIQEYNDGSFAGKSYNKVSDKHFFLLVTPDVTNEYIIVTAVDFSTIEAMAKTIALAVIIITTVIFIAVSIAIYFYITRITKPLNDIIVGTKVMVAEQDKNIQIPISTSMIRTETADAIININNLYTSLMLTQERLLEKSEFLATQLKEKEIEQKSRAKFIADTSHELKTPISIIQGYAEGIKYVLDDKEAAFEYCDTIIEECGRMTDLVVNMMSLSNIQHTDMLKYSDFLINEFIDERMKLHDKIFRKNNITATNKLDGRMYGYADVSKLQFVINNLISNAISYIGGEDKRIEITSKDLGLCYRIYVFNTGDHIPSDVLQQLWDSFYRLDAARLRSEGHFGLGLSIVKATQDAHSQQCGVDNTDGGVQFWFDIAKGTPPEDE